jgi:hypothetical protein
VSVSVSVSVSVTLECLYNVLASCRLRLVSVLFMCRHSARVAIGTRQANTTSSNTHKTWEERHVSQELSSRNRNGRYENVCIKSCLPLAEDEFGLRWAGAKPMMEFCKFLPLIVQPCFSITSTCSTRQHQMARACYDQRQV